MAPPNPRPKSSTAIGATMYTPLTPGHVDASIAKKREASSTKASKEEGLGTPLSSVLPVASEVSIKRRFSGLSQIPARFFSSRKRSGSSKRQSPFVVSESDRSRLETPHSSSSGDNTYNTRVSFSDFPTPPIFPGNQTQVAPKVGNQFEPSDPVFSASSPPPSGGSHEETYPLPGVLSELEPPSTAPHPGRDTNWPLEYYLVFPTLGIQSSSIKERDVHIYRSNIAPTDLVNFIGPLPQPASEYLAMILQSQPHRAAEIKRIEEEFMKQQDGVVKAVCERMVRAVNDQKEYVQFLEERLEIEKKQRTIPVESAESAVNSQARQFVVLLQKDLRVHKAIINNMTDDLNKIAKRSKDFAEQNKDLRAQIYGMKHVRRQEQGERAKLEAEIAELKAKLAEKDRHQTRLEAFYDDFLLMFESHHQVDLDTGELSMRPMPPTNEGDLEEDRVISGISELEVGGNDTDEEDLYSADP